MRRRLTDIEALMWGLEQHPMLASTMGSIAMLEGVPDERRFRNAVAHAVLDVERLRHRVSAPVLPFADLEWESDPDFDLDHHVRTVRMPPGSTLDDLFDLATQIVNDPFDRSRPLWSMTLITGLQPEKDAAEKAALVVKAHHSIADGQGLIRLGLGLFDLAADVDPRPSIDLPTAITELTDAERSDEASSPRDAVAEAIRGRVERFLGLAVQAVGTLGSPSRAADLAHEIAATTELLSGGVVKQPSVSPLWTRRSRNRRSFHLHCSLPDLRTQASALGCSVNDLFMVACADAALGYHRVLGVDLEHVSTSFVISTRTDDHPDAHNAVVPCGIVMPGSGATTTDRLHSVRTQVAERRAAIGARQPGLDAASQLAGFVPDAVAAATAVEQARKLDFATSNLPGPELPLWLAASPVEWFSPLGPVAGTAFNVTMLSFLDDAALGVHYDPAAVADAPLLAGELRSSLARLHIDCRTRSSLLHD